jgi:RHS repeat-associated protein
MSQGSIYDAENKQIEVRDSRQNVIGQYRYDGDGKRIRKIVPSTDEVTVFVYSAGGQLVAEYSTEISQAPKVSYTTADNLGSPRILTDENGATISRRDFHPFGEEVFTPERSAALGYQPDDVRQKFTTYQRDGETDLEFAQARMYLYVQGRFSSPDPYMPSAVIEIPQSWNRYVYVMNRPLIYIDPDGEAWLSTGDANNPYTWVDKCEKGQRDCHIVIAVQVGNTLRVYGSNNADDITNYEANRHGMVDMRKVAEHHDAQFIFQPAREGPCTQANRCEPYLNVAVGAALFDVAYLYSQAYSRYFGWGRSSRDAKLSMVSGSFADGTSDRKRSHKGGRNVDLRYMSATGTVLSGDNASKDADVSRTLTLLRLFREQKVGLDSMITGTPDRFGLPDLDSDTKHVHRNHLHMQQSYPAVVPKRPGRKK